MVKWLDSPPELTRSTSFGICVVPAFETAQNRSRSSPLTGSMVLE